MPHMLFTAGWCAPCQELNDIKENPPKGLEIIDVDKNPELVREKGIVAIPSLLKENGELVVGPAPIREEIEKLREENAS